MLGWIQSLFTPTELLVASIPNLVTTALPRALEDMSQQPWQCSQIRLCLFMLVGKVEMETKEMLVLEDSTVEVLVGFLRMKIVVAEEEVRQMFEHRQACRPVLLLVEVVVDQDHQDQAARQELVEGAGVWSGSVQGVKGVRKLREELEQFHATATYQDKMVQSDWEATAAQPVMAVVVVVVTMVVEGARAMGEVEDQAFPLGQFLPMNKDTILATAT